MIKNSLSHSNSSIQSQGTNLTGIFGTSKRAASGSTILSVAKSFIQNSRNQESTKMEHFTKGRWFNQRRLIRLVKIEGCHYELSETQIRGWLELYGSVQGDVLEETLVDEIDSALMGTGAYLAKVILSR